MYNVNRLRLLRELSLRGTLGEVADAMLLSPSSVSQQLAQLEREVGRPLLRKVGRRVQLTAAADILVRHTEAILNELDQAAAELAAGERASGILRIAIFQSAALALTVRMLDHLADHHPDLRVMVSQREPETALRESSLRAFDLVVAEQYPGHTAPWHPELDRVPLTTDPLRLAVPRGGGWDSITSVTQCREAAWVVEQPRAASRHWAEQVCRGAGFEPRVHYETADLQAHLALIGAGKAVAFLPGLLQAENHPEIRLIDLPAGPRRTVFTATRQSIAETPRVLACRAALAAAVAATTPGNAFSSPEATASGDARVIADHGESSGTGEDD